MLRNNKNVEKKVKIKIYMQIYAKFFLIKNSQELLFRMSLQLCACIHNQNIKESEDNFCFQCGKRLREVCENCDTKLYRNAIFCHKCGSNEFEKNAICNKQDPLFLQVANALLANKIQLCDMYVDENFNELSAKLKSRLQRTDISIEIVQRTAYFSSLAVELTINENTYFHKQAIRKLAEIWPMEEEKDLLFSQLKELFTNGMKIEVDGVEATKKKISNLNEALIAKKDGTLSISCEQDFGGGFQARLHIGQKWFMGKEAVIKLTEYWCKTNINNCFQDPLFIKVQESLYENVICYHSYDALNAELQKKFKGVNVNVMVVQTYSPCNGYEVHLLIEGHKVNIEKLAAIWPRN